MNPQSITDMLEPLRAPDPISWWPPAPGWWLLALIVLALLVLGLRLLLQRYRRGAPLREARTELSTLANGNLENRELTAELARLQRRVAIALVGRRACAGLTGLSWAQLLNSLTRDEQACFDETLVSLPHRGQISDADTADFLEATERWMAALDRQP